MSRIDVLFDNLDRWRHLPAYQLERRADAFFAIYLEDIVQARFSSEVEGIIPEFPVRIGTIRPGSASNQSFKIDYLVKLKHEGRILLVELKTDSASRRGTQDQYLRDSKAVGFNALLQGVLEIYSATRAKKKYRCLLEELQALGMVRKSDQNSYVVVPSDSEIEILYLQPNTGDENEDTITFAEAADIITANEDEVSRRFAESLRRWSAVTAGEC